MTSNGHDHDTGPMRRRGLLRRQVSVAVASAALIVSAPEARAQAAGGRMALVIGNSAYAHTAALANPVNDADDVGAALAGLGFSVRIRKNLDRAALYDEVAAFGRRSAASEIAVLFYAGHGIEVNGTSYLVPVDARLATDTDTYQAVPLDDVQARIRGAGLRLVILDACRDNPLATGMHLSDPTRSFSRGGLGALRSEPLGGTLVWYAASAGETAPDGGGGARNSPFTRALLTHLSDPVELGTVFVRVTNTVYRTTGGRQEPTAYGSRRSEYYLSPPAGFGRVLIRTTPAGALVTLDGRPRGAAPLSLGDVSPGTHRLGIAAPGYVSEEREITVSAGAPATAVNVALTPLAAVEAPARGAPAGAGSLYVVSRPAGATVTVDDAVVGVTPVAAPDVAFGTHRVRIELPGYRPRVFEVDVSGTEPVRLGASLEPALRSNRRLGPDPVTAPDPVPTMRPGEVFRDCAACPEMVVIPAGTFMMGSPTSETGRDDDEGPQHLVTLRSFALGVKEVTFNEWDACVRGGGCDGYRPDDVGWGRGARPVINVSWEDAQAYVEWLSERTGAEYRLPSESEWEYAARAGTTTPFHTGSTISTDQANYDGNRRRTTPVGTFAPNAFGLYDVHGNVYEWVEDCWYGDYHGAPSDGTAWERRGDCGRRVSRGGSWLSPPRRLRSAVRAGITTGNRHNFIAGFRVSRTLD